MFNRGPTLTEISPPALTLGVNTNLTDFTPKSWLDAWGMHPKEQHILECKGKKYQLLHHFTPEKVCPWGRYSYTNNHLFNCFPTSNGKSHFRRQIMFHLKCQQLSSSGLGPRSGPGHVQVRSQISRALGVTMSKE